MTPRRPLLPFLFLLALADGSSLTVAATPKKGAAFAPEQIEYFEKHVRPLLTAKCVECHGPKLQEAGLRLDSRSGVLKGMEGVPAAVPGDPTKSRIIAVVKYDGDVQMPPDGKLPDDQLATLTNWVKIGLPWPEETAATTTAAAEGNVAWGGTMDERIVRARREHWAFQPVRKLALPAVVDPAWSQNPVDRFVAAKLAEAQLTPSPEADSRTLIRRLYFDLLGLPPTPEEVDEFVSKFSSSPRLPVSQSSAKDEETRRRGDGEKAYVALVDKLLASPRYGERWARHWLDLARYADTKGYAFQQERRFPFAYTYRDYVIRAFNDDKPYDQFILEQLAGDKLPPQPDNAGLAAMGFITCGRQYQGMHDTLDDQIDVVTRGLLGLTASCARCHDHKFDPIPTTDYYSLYGVFRSSTTPEELPPLGDPIPSSEYDAFKKEFAKLQGERDQFVGEQLDKLMSEFRSRATDYLARIVLDGLDKESSAKEKDYLFDEGDPRPQIVRRWRDLLSATKRKPDAVFGVWHRLDDLSEADFEKRAPETIAAILKDAESGKPEKAVNRLLVEALRKQTPKSMLEVAKLYGGLFEKIEADWRKRLDPKSRKEGEAAPTALADAAAEQLRQVLYRSDSPTVVNFEFARLVFDRKVRTDIESRQKKVDQLVVTSPGAPPRAMSLVDMAKPFDPRVFIRGDAARAGEAVPRQFLKILSPGDDRKPFADGSGRLGLAQAIASRENPLTARVMANRVWMLHFGRGLVETPSDFGVRTPPPSHPELLDYLAAEFMDEGWSVKRLHRLIVTSQTYRQASSGLDSSLATRATMVDPENRLLWKMNRRRIEFEAMRDGMLAVAGRLDVKPFGRPVDLWKVPYATRRTVYGYIDRQDLPGVFAVFDFASPDVTIDQRPRTTVPQQALFAMNSPFVQEQARHIAARPEIAKAADEAARATALFRTVYGRPPSGDEAENVRRFLANLSTLPAVSTYATWQYGSGEFDVEAGATKSFTPFANWNGKEWHPGEKVPDSKFGYVALRAGGGHPGHTAKMATIIRWRAPRSGTFAIDGVLKHPEKKGNGNGVAAHAWSPRVGRIGTWIAEHSEAKTDVAKVELEAGETLDLVVESRGDGSFDSYAWEVKVLLVKAAPSAAPTKSADAVTVWDATKEFRGPASKPLTAWEMLAQVLLMSNEFMFVD